MPLPDNTENNPRLNVLRKREAALRSAIAAEKVKQQKRDEREATRLGLIVGSALVSEGQESPEFRDMLIRILRGSDMNESDKGFLQKKGWL